MDARHLPVEVCFLLAAAWLVACAEDLPPGSANTDPDGTAAMPVRLGVGTTSSVRRRIDVRRVDGRAELTVGASRVALDADGGFDRERMEAVLVELAAHGDFLEVELVVPAGIPVESLVFFLEEKGKVAIIRAPAVP